MNVRSEVGVARPGGIDTSRLFTGECNGCRNNCPGVAAKSSCQAIPILGTLGSPSDLGGNTCTPRSMIAIVNVTLYYSTTCVRLEHEASVWDNCGSTPEMWSQKP